jgi:predicted nucleic acid-binding protein
MNGADCFVDTNVLLYVVSDELDKIIRTQQVINSSPFISVQVLNEFVSVSRRKLKLEWDELNEVLAPLRNRCRIIDLKLEIHERAMELAESSLINIYDACIVAAAEHAGCRTLFSEDLNHGQRIGGVTVCNPFL